jgi:hypothetical protein
MKRTKTHPEALVKVMMDLTIRIGAINNIEVLSRLALHMMLLELNRLVVTCQFSLWEGRINSP